MVMLHIKLKGNTYSNMVANILPTDPPTPHEPGVGVKRSKLTFSDPGQYINLKGVSNAATWCKYIAHRPTPLCLALGLVQKIKIQLFQNIVMLHIKLKLHSHKFSNIVANMLPADHPAQPMELVSKGQNSTFSEHGHVAHQVKWNYVCSIIVANILPAEPPCTPPTLGCVVKR